MTAVAVVIVTFRSPPGLLERTVTSVLDSSDDDVMVRVIDNGGEAADRLAAHPRGSGSLADHVTISVVENEGFGAAANVGIDLVRADGHVAVVVLNDDVEVSPGWLELLVAELGADDVGAVQPLLVSTDDRFVNSAGVDVDRYGAGSDRSRGQPVASIDPTPCDLDVFTGGAVLLSSSFIEDVGGFDERFFLYYEDVELARRGSSSGWRYRLVPSVHVRHQGSATTDTLGDVVVRLRERNRLWCAAMTGSRSVWLRGTWLSIRRVRHHPRRAHISGLVAGLIGSVPRALKRSTSHVGS